MKRLISVVMCAFILLLVCVACDEKSYDTRTAQFYDAMDKKSFWYKAYITENGETYSVTQATNGVVTTTIENHDKNSKDKYQLYDGGIIQSLNFPNKCYDTIVTKNGIPFRFAEYEPYMFAVAVSAGEEVIDGVTFYCETFEVTVNDGKSTVLNKYYYDEERLVLIETVESGKTTLLIEFEEYSNTIPDDVYLSIPEGFSARNYIEENEIDFSQVVGDWIDKIPSEGK